MATTCTYFAASLNVCGSILVAQCASRADSLQAMQTMKADTDARKVGAGHLRGRSETEVIRDLRAGGWR